MEVYKLLIIFVNEPKAQTNLQTSHAEMTESIFMQFCRYVDESIFPRGNRGESVAFIVDQAFIDGFCKKFSTSEKLLLKDVQNNIYRTSKDNHLHVKGILAIQLYAATKREDSGSISASAYRIRLCQLLDWDINYNFTPWMETHQKDFWAALYSWCDKNDFKITHYHTIPGPWCYVQYPVKQAERIFTHKDLKAIAYHFVENKLQPGEDISERDFWNILNRYRLPSYVHTSHGRKIVENQEYLQDAYGQVYNFFLRWNGDYLDILKHKSAKVNNEQYFLYLSEEGHIDVRDEDFNRMKSIEWEKLSVSSLDSLYSFKRNQVILFRRNDDYPGYWEETRYLERKETDGKSFFEEGMAIFFTDSDSVYRYSSNPFYSLTPTFANSRIKIYKIQYSNNLAHLYTEKKFFGLEGGLKIGRMKYLLGGAPILSLTRHCHFWIDGQKPPTNPINGHLNLNFLTVGTHEIKFSGFKKIEFTIDAPDISNQSWNESYTKWLFSSKDKQWIAAKSQEGIVGLNYSIFKIVNKDETPTDVLTRWAKFHLMGQSDTYERNIALKILNKHKI